MLCETKVLGLALGERQSLEAQTASRASNSHRFLCISHGILGGIIIEMPTSNQGFRSPLRPSSRSTFGHTEQVYERPDAGPRPINYQFLNRRLLWDHWSRMVYVIAPLINWASIRRAFARGTGRLRREARALGVIGGSDRARHDATLGSGTFAREARDTSPRYTAATSSLCAECGATPAKASGS